MLTEKEAEILVVRRAHGVAAEARLDVVETGLSAEEKLREILGAHLGELATLLQVEEVLAAPILRVSRKVLSSLCENGIGILIASETSASTHGFKGRGETKKELM